MPEGSTIIDIFNNYAKSNSLFIIGGAISAFAWTYFGPKILGKKDSLVYSRIYHSILLAIGVYGLYLKFVESHEQQQQQSNYTYNYYYQ